MGITVDFMEYTIGNQDGAAVPCPVTPTRPDHPPERFEITEEQRHILTRDGVVHIKNVLSPEWLEYLRANSEWQIEHPHIWASPGVASGLYDYIQRNVWTTNTGFYNFLAYGPLSHVLAQLGGALTGQDGPCDEVRITTDLLMVNPNKGFKWHQDNQNGPVSFDDALRWWVTMDDTPADHGAPVYLRGSQNNTSVGEDAVPRARRAVVQRVEPSERVDGDRDRARVRIRPARAEARAHRVEHRRLVQLAERVHVVDRLGRRRGAVGERQLERGGRELDRRGVARAPHRHARAAAVGDELGAHPDRLLVGHVHERAALHPDCVVCARLAAPPGLATRGRTPAHKRCAGDDEACTPSFGEFGGC